MCNIVACLLEFAATRTVPRTWQGNSEKPGICIHPLRPGECVIIRLTFVTLSGVDLEFFKVCWRGGGWGKYWEKKYVLNTQEFHKHAILALPSFSPFPFFSSFLAGASFYMFYLTSIYREVSPETLLWKHKWIVLSYIYSFSACVDVD